MLIKKELATHIVKTLQEAGYIAYFAGGWVRDYIMKYPSDDIDIATNASVDEVRKLFPKTIPVGVAFGIVIVVQENHQFEVATFRKDRGYVDGRRPSGIDPSHPEEDAKRRDFTINGLFYDPINKTLYDYVGGKEDIKKGIIRAIGDPRIRFAEDRLRMMRAVRYCTRFGFPIEENTLNAIKSHAKDLLPAVAMERIWQEFKKMSHFAHFDTGLILLHELGLLSTIFPQLKEISSNQIKTRVKHIENFPKGAPTFAELLELFPDHNLNQIYALSDHLKLSNEEKAFAKFYHHAQSLFNMPEEWQEKLEKIEWAEFYADPFAQISLEMIAARYPNEKRRTFLSKHKKRIKTLENPIRRIREKQPYLRAKDLIDEGIEPGEQLGKLLKEGMRLAVNEEIEDPQSIIAKLKKSPLWP